MNDARFSPDGRTPPWGGLGRWVKRGACVLALGLVTGCSHRGDVEPAPEVRPKVHTVEEAAELVGREVTVAGEVKGVSKSPRSGVVYLSFGDAYPRQSLSVKIPAENTEAHKGGPYFGRMVRVTGRIEQAKEGPLIVLADASRLEILRSPVGDVLNETGEGPAYYWRVRGAVYDKWLARDYAGLEALARKWRKEKTRMLDGYWLLPHFYGVIGWEAEGDPALDPRFAEIEAWREARPDAVEPVIVLATMWVRYAWEARGGGYAPTVTEEGWRLMGERLAKARLLLDGLGPRFAGCPEAAVVMQRIALGQGWSAGAYAALYEAAIAREPEYLDFYFAKARHLLPRWYGAQGEWESYARAAAPGWFGLELRAHLASEQRETYWNVMKESALDWAEVREGFEALRRRYPRSASTLATYALFAGFADDRETCLRLLNEAGDSLDMGVWGNWENVAFARRWATEPGQPPPVIFRLVKKREPLAEAANAPRSLE